jgi:hypothetical protein
MTWAKISDTFIDDPVLLGLPRGARLLYVEGIVWCCKHETDGRIPGHVLRRITDEPEFDAAVALLVTAGLWSATETGFIIEKFLVDQISADQVAKRRADERLRQERNRLHKAGDHSLCTKGKFCPDGLATRDNTRDNTRDPARESPTPVPSRPVPTSREGKGQGTGAAPPAPLGSQGLAPSKPRTVTTPTPQDRVASKGRGFSVTMPIPPADQGPGAVSA